MKIKLIDIIIVSLVIAVVFIIVLMINPLSKEKSAESVSQDLKIDSDELCAVQPGYDEKEWREHMSHHPDRYKDCL